MRFRSFLISEDKEALKENAYYLFAIDGNHYYYVTEMPEHVSDAYELCPTTAYRKMHPMYQAFAGDHCYPDSPL